MVWEFCNTNSNIIQMARIVNNEIRFLILKRDNFTCQYCGRSAPDVKLEVDHIKPHSKNGTVESDNLITSCSECSSGKRDKDVDIKKPEKIYLPDNTKVHYPVFQARLSEETIVWLRGEYGEYDSWNKLFNEIKNRYNRGYEKKNGKN